MGKSNDYVGDEIYRKHLTGDGRRFMPNAARTKNQALQRMYVKRLTELYCNRFEWRGMPISTDQRFTELQLLYAGLAVFFWDDRFDQYMCLRGTPSGGWNPTDNPTRFTVVGNNFPSVILRSRDCVPIWANYSRTPDIDIIQIYAQRLADLDVTIDINSRNARVSRIIAGPETQRLTNANVERLYDEGAPFIQVGESYIASATNMDIGIDPRSIENLHVLRVRLWNECMMLLGIDGANQDKTERLVAGEVDANNEQVYINRRIALNAREIACDQIKSKYGLNVSVAYRTGNVGKDEES